MQSFNLYKPRGPVAARAAATLLSFLFLGTQQAQACAACGCSLAQEWQGVGYSESSGLKLDVRYDYLGQNDLRSGRHRISPQAASQVVNDGEAQEVESYTRNHYLTASIDYTVNPDWGINLVLPYVVRSHVTLGTASDGITPGPDGGQYQSRTASLGDVKVLGRYQGLLPAGNLSLQWGLKLPTGSYTDQGQSTDPTAPGAVDIDRGLQPGTGTIDVILGASYVDTLAPGWSYMVQGLWQTAMHSTQGYRPGNAFNGNLGLRYTAWASWQPQLQLNTRYALRDSGPQADAVSTGGTLVYLSPGINVPLTDRLAAYAYAQLPIYQDVHGVQLTPKSSASVGVRMAF